MTTTLTFGQMSYNGVLLGPGGVAQVVSAPDTLVGLGNVRSGDVSRPNQTGMLAGYDFSADRLITLDLEVVMANSNTHIQNLNLLRAAFQPVEALGGGLNAGTSNRLVYNMGEGGSSSAAPGYNRFITCRTRKFSASVDVGFAAGGFMTGIIPVTIQLDAVDPTIYDNNVQSATVGLTVAAGGWVFPWTFPWTFTTSSGGLVFATNAGWAPCYPLVTITGPCINPRIEQQTTGETCGFTMTMASTDTLVVDMYNGSAILNGTASRLNALTPGSQFFDLPGTTTSTIGFYSSDATTTAATMTVEWANAYN